MKYDQLTTQERYPIAHRKSSAHSQGELARMLNRSVSTISRELRRNVSSDDWYRPTKADRHAWAQVRRTTQRSREVA